MKFRALLTVACIAVFFTGTTACGDDPTPGSGSNDDTNQQQNANQQNDDNENNDEQLDIYDPADEDRETAIEFIVENGATIPFYIQISTPEDPAPDWLSITHFGEPINPHPNCMPELCDEDKIPVCDEPQNEILKLEPQDTVNYKWDGSNYQISDDGCTQRFEITDEELEAEMCWGMDADEDEQLIEDVDCGSSEIAPPETSAGEVSITVN